VVQAGVARQVDLEACRQVMQGLVRFLCACSALEGPGEPPQSARPLVFDNAQVAFVYGTRAGLFLPAVKPGARVTEGAVLGTVIGVMEGEVRERVRAPCLGTVLTLRALPVTYEGELIARIVAPAPIPGNGERSEYEAQ
jgi:predicted deacylase